MCARKHTCIYVYLFRYCFFIKVSSKLKLVCNFVNCTSRIEKHGDTVSSNIHVFELFISDSKNGYKHTFGTNIHLEQCPELKQE